jgi:hypothetical protein
MPEGKPRRAKVVPLDAGMTQQDVSPITTPKDTREGVDAFAAAVSLLNVMTAWSVDVALNRRSREARLLRATTAGEGRERIRTVRFDGLLAAAFSGDPALPLL